MPTDSDLCSPLFPAPRTLARALTWASTTAPTTQSHPHPPTAAGGVPKINASERPCLPAKPPAATTDWGPDSVQGGTEPGPPEPGPRSRQILHSAPACHTHHALCLALPSPQGHPCPCAISCLTGPHSAFFSSVCSFPRWRLSTPNSHASTHAGPAETRGVVSGILQAHPQGPGMGDYMFYYQFTWVWGHTQ